MKTFKLKSQLCRKPSSPLFFVCLESLTTSVPFYIQGVSLTAFSAMNTPTRCCALHHDFLIAGRNLPRSGLHPRSFFLQVSVNGLLQI